MYGDVFIDTNIIDDKIERNFDVKDEATTITLHDITKGHYFRHIIKFIMEEYDISPDLIEQQTGLEAKRIITTLNRIEDVDEIILMDALFHYMSCHTNWQSCSKSLAKVRMLIVKLCETHNKYLINKLYEEVDLIGTDD